MKIGVAGILGRSGALALLVFGNGIAAEAQTKQGPHHHFDGTWHTIVSCSNARDALGYSFEFVSIVKDDQLHGEKGVKGEAGWLQIDGQIQADGAANLYASGLVGAAPYAVGGRPAGSLYGYHIDTHFSGSSGEGRRVEGRPCTVSFTKQG
jgi:hypothetical protein